ncbi:MAG: T9SS type A sorting domain-containing protein [Sphingobacteriales bacterium]|nr:MAG: T9SS type A sorting domain-containing protein [Sphingobacteriales bacterium]
MKKYLILLAVACLGKEALAQQTGSFNSSVTFNGTARTLANYVPATYTAAQPHKLVIALHGMGDAAASYRNALVNSLAFPAAFPNTILICPDGGADQGRDFYQPAGDELIIEEAINFARTNYNIDTTEIILQGFSLGGRSALKYGLEHASKFKALLLNTPAIQGVKEAANEAIFNYNFSAAHELPIYVTIGNNDPLYNEPVNRTVAQLVANNGMVAYKIFPGAHTVPAFQNYPYATFFNQPFSNGPDAGIYKLNVPERSCDGTIAASVLLQNTGNISMDSVQLVYGIGNDLDTVNWQGNLAQHESALISLPAYDAGSLSTDHYDFEVSITGLNQQITDTFAGFNATEKQVHIMPEVLSIPFEEHFQSEASLSKWALNNSGDYILPFEYYEEDAALFSLNSIFIFDNSGTREEAISPKLDFRNQGNVYLHFNVDYNYVQYTANVFADTVFADTLEVLVTTDCGATYTSLFKKAGADLSGHNEPLLNPLSIDAIAVAKDESKYRSFTVDVSQFAGQENVAFKFSYISALGGYIYLDDVSVTNSPVSTKNVAVKQSVLSLFPNPTDGLLQLTLNNGKSIESVTVCNITGQEVLNLKGSGTAAQQINTTHLPAGVYWLQLKSGSDLIKAKFVKQ